MAINNALVYHLSNLKSNRERADHLHRELGEEESEDQIGALLLGREGTLLALTEARTEALVQYDALPGSLFAWPVWTPGTEALITWHTNFRGSSDPSPKSLAFAENLIDLGGVVGIPVLDHWIFGRRPELLALRSWQAWDWPKPSLDRLQTKPAPANRTATEHRNPITGESWSGLGRHRPAWIREATENGLQAHAFRNPLGKIPRPASFGTCGSVFFRYFGPPLRSLRYQPPEGFESLTLTGEDFIALETHSLAPMLLSIAGPLPTPYQVWGALFLDVAGRVRRPVAGAWAPHSVLAGRPSKLFSGSMQTGFSRLLTFSIDTSQDTPAEGSFALAERILLIGEALGFPIDDHLFIHSESKAFSWRRTTRWKWPSAEVGLRQWPFQ